MRNRYSGRARQRQPQLLCVALGLPLARYWRLRQEPCANALDFADDDFVVRLVNGTEHLTDANIGESPLTPTRQ